MSGPFCEAFMLIGELAYARGARNIKATTGLHRFDIDATWSVAVNPHAEKIENVLPYHAMVWFNGWPAGIVFAYGGSIVAGDGANEDSLVKALRAAIDRQKVT